VQISRKMAPKMQMKAAAVNLIGKIGFGKVPQESEYFIGVAVVIMFLIAYYVVSASRKTTKSSSKSKKSPSKAALAASSPREAAKPTKESGSPKKDKTPAKQSAPAPSKTTPEMGGTARKSERLRGKTPKKWD
jgi:hypothetical protein